jgi:hypothetical protein
MGVDVNKAEEEGRKKAEKEKVMKGDLCCHVDSSPLPRSQLRFFKAD